MEKKSSINQELGLIGWLPYWQWNFKKQSCF